MIRKIKFPGIQGQVGLSHVSVTHRSRGALAFEIGTVQKYCEVLGYSGSEIHIAASEYTPKDKYDPGLPASTVIFPRFVRGWDVTYAAGRYTILVALNRRSRSSRRSGIVYRDEEWRIQYFRNGKGARDA